MRILLTVLIITELMINQSAYAKSHGQHLHLNEQSKVHGANVKAFMGWHGIHEKIAYGEKVNLGNAI